MDTDKPFKTIEVLDARTKQLCKVACMSCIRGHRTTSCGIPVCRSKVFWTVKRPGRPSNSCTCRYGATGGCKCVVARAACPHKAKKGEKRSGECRCDESGRYCCLLEPDHWTALLALQKPTVDFFPTREVLEAKQAATDQSLLPPTPAYSAITSPPSAHSLPSTPAPLAPSQHVPIAPHIYNGYPSPSVTVTARFGMMGVGAPMGPGTVSADVLRWEGQAPPAPRDFNPLYSVPEPEPRSCCQTSVPSAQGVQLPGTLLETPISQPTDVQDTVFSQPYGNGVPATVSMPQVSPAPFDFEKLRMDYFHHQFPNSICQNCGLSGCTCRNCPPIFQNFGTTSWAQCCGRKHARDVQTTPVPQKVPRTEKYEPSQGLRSEAAHERPTLPQPFADSAPFQLNGAHFAEAYPDVRSPPVPDVPRGFTPFDLDHDFGGELSLPDDADLADLSEFLLSDLDRSNADVVHSEAVPQGAGDGTGSEEDGGGESGGGCCCSGG